MQFKNTMDNLLCKNAEHYNRLQHCFSEVNNIDVTSPLSLMFVAFCLGTDSEDILLHKAIKEYRTNPNIKDTDQLYKWCTDELGGKHEQHQISI